MAIYLKLDGVEGNVTTTGFEGQIEILSFSFGTSRNIATAARTATNRESNEPCIGEVTLTKLWDATSSPKLFEQSVAGTLDHTATITFTTTSADKVEKYLEIELSKTGISSFEMSSDDDKPAETIDLNFSKIQYKPFTIDSNKNAKTGKVVTYDLSQMKANT
jgi:type VI secretion system secreted protein Hcp